eukprot:m.98990 g.98990  ORF g.98990 m.98990 type:complete len:251 (+) comp37024_c1_seq4:32-784(+)
MAVRLKDLKRLMKDKQRRSGGIAEEDSSKKEKEHMKYAKSRKRMPVSDHHFNDQKTTVSEAKTMKENELIDRDGANLESVPKEADVRRLVGCNENDEESEGDGGLEEANVATVQLSSVCQDRAAEQEVKRESSKLPEGFFDDPRMDAKARKVEYKDKMNEEWEAFQKSIKAESQVSEAITEAEAEDDKDERLVTEVLEQRDYVSRVVNLWKKKESLIENPVSTVKEKEENVTGDTVADFDEFLDWRVKKV